MNNDNQVPLSKKTEFNDKREAAEDAAWIRYVTIEQLNAGTTSVHKWASGFDAGEQAAELTRLRDENERLDKYRKYVNKAVGVDCFHVNTKVREDNGMLDCLDCDGKEIDYQDVFEAIGRGDG